VPHKLMRDAVAAGDIGTPSPPSCNMRCGCLSQRSVGAQAIPVPAQAPRWILAVHDADCLRFTLGQDPQMVMATTTCGLMTAPPKIAVPLMVSSIDGAVHQPACGRGHHHLRVLAHVNEDSPRHVPPDPARRLRRHRDRLCAKRCAARGSRTACCTMAADGCADVTRRDGVAHELVWHGVRM